MSSWLGNSKKKDVADELEAIRSEIASIAHRVSGIAGMTGDKLRGNVAQLRASLPDSDSVSRAADSAMDQGRYWLGQAGGGVREARAVVQQNPTTSIAIAAGIGFLVGLMVGSSRSEDEG
ncbi:hypothetical protein GCM10019059_14620 [Camelimonas fluminis]|uniref:YqjD family protein n=1 Tax=Camelimonas fluminis TaxID=1576911 RepID=A0ABV7UMA3_9HYPH|nr:DUF883 family protein [Camelimonas fluminis]GHE56401.1 hypothetical protein GCM10019059_14620 [Camelimonas fluminis]